MEDTRFTISQEKRVTKHFPELSTNGRHNIHNKPTKESNKTFSGMSTN
jgi:hypothetical protein